MAAASSVHLAPQGMAITSMVLDIAADNLYTVYLHVRRCYHSESSQTVLYALLHFYNASPSHFRPRPTQSAQFTGSTYVDMRKLIMGVCLHTLHCINTHSEAPKVFSVFYIRVPHTPEITSSVIY